MNSEIINTQYMNLENAVEFNRKERKEHRDRILVANECAFTPHPTGDSLQKTKLQKVSFFVFFAIFVVTSSPVFRMNAETACRRTVRVARLPGQACTLSRLELAGAGWSWLELTRIFHTHF